MVGGFVLWLQAGLLYSVGSLAYGGYGLQSNLVGAADGLQSGDYDEARARYEAAQASTGQLDRSVGVGQVDLVGNLPGVSVAVENWRLARGRCRQHHEQHRGAALPLRRPLRQGRRHQDLQRRRHRPRAARGPAGPRHATADDLDAAAAALEGIRAATAPAAMLDRVRDKALSEMEPIQQAVDSLGSIAPVLPDALGANGVRRYLVAIGNQAEMRAAGGAPLTLVLVEFNEGRISIPIKGQTSTQLFPPLNAPVSWWGPAANPFFPGNPRNAPFVVTNTHPNMLFSAQEMAGAWAGGDYPPVDGVITLDLTAIAAVLDATGPVESPVVRDRRRGAARRRSCSSTRTRTFGQEGATERQQANQELLDDLLDRLLSGDDLVSAAQAIASTAPGRHVQFWMRSPELQRLAMESGAAGVVDDPGTGDWSAAVHAERQPEQGRRVPAAQRPGHGPAGGGRLGARHAADDGHERDAARAARGPAGARRLRDDRGSRRRTSCTCRTRR